MQVHLHVQSAGFDRDTVLVQEPAEDAENQLLPAAVAKEFNDLVHPLRDLGRERYLQSRQRFDLVGIRGVRD